MEIFLKTTAGVLTAIILWLCLNTQGKDFYVLLNLAVCTMIIAAGFAFLKPVLDFVENIRSVGNLDGQLLSVILKVVGIGLITEVCTHVCKDAGNESMGKSLQILSSVMILWMSIPVFEKLLSLLDEILGSV